MSCFVESLPVTIPEAKAGRRDSLVPSSVHCRPHTTVTGDRGPLGAAADHVGWGGGVGRNTDRMQDAGAGLEEPSTSEEQPQQG